MTSQEGFSLLKSFARRFFSFTVIYKPSRPIRILLATHGLRNTDLAQVRFTDNRTKACNQRVVLRISFGWTNSCREIYHA